MEAAKKSFRRHASRQFHPELEGKDIWGDDADDIDDEIMSVSLVAQRAAFRNSRMVPPLTSTRWVCPSPAVARTRSEPRRISRKLERGTPRVGRARRRTEPLLGVGPAKLSNVRSRAEAAARTT